MDHDNDGADATIVPGAGTRVRIGDRFRDWEVDSFLGAGSFGSVWRAHRNRLGGQQVAAIKILDRLLVADAREQLVAEFNVLSSIEHPNLLRYLDAFEIEDGKHAGFVVFVLELADTDLRNAIDTSIDGLPERDMCSAFAGLADGLAAFHQAGHAHGDIKPANILRVGSSWKLADFGIAAPLDGSYSLVGGTTFDYCPPEELTGVVDTPVSSRNSGRRVHRTADVWALGISLHEAVTKRHPYLGDSPRTRMASIMSGRRSIDGGVSPGLAVLLDQRCLALDHHSRITPVDLATQLRALSNSSQAPSVLPPPPSPPSTSEPDQESLPRHTPPQPSSPPPSSAHPSSPQPSSQRPLIVGVLAVAVFAVAALVIGFMLVRGGDPAPPSSPTDTTSVTAPVDTAPVDTAPVDTELPSSSTPDTSGTITLNSLPPLP
jgi:eukaryotic-like serine/threonine-protein kinase